MPSPSQRLRFGPYLLDPVERSLLRHGQPVHLTPKLFETLLVLVRHVGRLVETEILISAVWKDSFVEVGNLAHNVSVLRKILGEGSGGHAYIETVPRHGYRFIGLIEPVEPGLDPSSPQSVSPAAATIHSLAVLPLSNHSPDSGQEYFADGMTEALITGLAQILPLRVISRTSVMRYKGAVKSLPEVAEELKVDAIVEGSVCRSGDRVRITVQLIHAPDDRHLWARTYDRDVQDVLTLQSELADAIADEIRIELEPRGRTGEIPLRRLSAAAYEAYLKGRYCWNLRTEEGLKKSIAYYLEALGKDSQYPLAYAGLADSYALLGNRRLGEVSPRKNMLLAKEAATMALDLDGNLAEAHLSLAMLKFQYDWDWNGAQEEFRRAIDLNPNAATSHQRYAMYLATMNRFSEAMREIERARDLDPLSPIIATAEGRLLHFQRRYDEAIECHRRALAIEPNFIEAHFNLGMIYEQKSMFQQAISEFQEVLRNAGGDAAFWSAGLGHAYGIAGMSADSYAILAGLQKPTLNRAGFSPFDIAWVHLGLGDTEAAFCWLEKAYEERCGALVYQNVEPALDVLRTDPRFANLGRRIGLMH